MAVNIDARYADQQVDFATLDQLYEPRTLESNWILAIRREKGHSEDFRLFIIGYKLKYWQQSGSVPPERKVLFAWKNTDAISQEPFIVIAQSEPDPRLRTRNFRFTASLVTFADKHVPPEQQDDFRAFVYGCRVTDIRLRASAQIQIIIDRWNKRSPAEHELYVSRGNHFHGKYQAQSPHLRPAANPKDHRYVVGPAPDPTTADIAFVNLNDSRPAHEPRRPSGSRWVFEKSLFQAPEIPAGGFHTQRIVHVFVLVSVDHRILKRMVVKIIGWPTVALVKLSLKREYDDAHERLSGVDCRHILKAYGKAIRRRATVPQLGYIFMEHAEHGDLGDFVERFIASNPTKQIPEPFLWLVFRALAEAVYAMAVGRPVPRNLPVDSSGTGLDLNPAEGWRPIINPDIKTYNIVLSAPQYDYYPAYPTAKMIDFGLCFDDKRYDVPSLKLAGVGTRGWGPPEQFLPPIPEYHNEPIDLASEIFNLGLVMLNLMEAWGIRCMTEKERQNGKFEHREGYSRCYSSRLEELVFRCLEFPKDKRPALTELLFFTRIGLREWERAYGSVNKPLERLPNFVKVEFAPDDRFRIGMTAPVDWKGMKQELGKGKKQELGREMSLEHGQKRKADEAGLEEEAHTPKKQRTKPYLPLPPLTSVLGTFQRSWSNYWRNKKPLHESDNLSGEPDGRQ